MLFDGVYIETEVDDSQVDRVTLYEGNTFPAVRKGSNRWYREVTTEFQYKVPDLP